MAMNVTFKKGEASSFATLTKKDASTFYYLTDTKALYLGENLIGDGVSLKSFEDLAKRVGTIEGKLSSIATSEEVSSATTAALTEAKNYSDSQLSAVVKKYLTGDNATDTIDTLIEIATWIADDEAGAAKIIADVDAVEKKLSDISTTVGAAIDSKIAAANLSQYMTTEAHNTFVSGNATLQSGITKAKVSEYDTTKNTVDTNKLAWDKAGTAVQPADIEDMETKSNAAKTYATKAELTNVQGDTTNTVRDCVNAINKLNNTYTEGTKTLSENIENIVKQLTWDTF